MALRLFIAFVFLAGSVHVTGQPNKLSNEERKDLVALASKLFNIDSEFAFQLSSYDIKQSYREIKDAEVYDNYYLVNYLDSLNKDPDNPLFNQKVGIFYQKNNYPKTAVKCFQKALENLDIRYFNQDSSQYYSFRGLLKIQIGLDGGYTDFERALAINAADSIASNFYYPSLCLSGEVEKLRAICSFRLERNLPNPSYPLLFLIMGEAYDRMQSIERMINENNEGFKCYRDTSFETFYHYDLVEKFAVQYAGNKEVKNTILLGNVLLLFLKGTFNSDQIFYLNGFDYPPDEINRLQKLQDDINEALLDKTLNEYNAYEALGFTYLMQNKYEDAIHYFKKGIDGFPKKKLGDYFEPSGSYTGLNTVYQIQKDTTMMLENTEKKLENLGDNYMRTEDYLLMAMCNFFRGDYPKAEACTVQAIRKNPRDARAFLLRAHLFFLLGNNSMIGEYLKQANERLTSKEQAARLLLQNAIYETYFGNFQNASGLLSQARIIRGTAEWELADTLEQKFISPRWP